MKRELLIWTLILVLVSSYASGLGIAPGETEIPYKPGDNTRVDLKIMNSGHRELKVVLYAEGELADKITFQDPILDIQKDQAEVKTNYVIHQPGIGELKKQGTHEINIVAREIIGESKGAIGASLAVVSRLKLMVPYKGKYVRSRLFVANFQNGQPSNFVVETENLGDEDVVQGQASVDVLGPFNEKIMTLTSDVQRIGAKSRVLFTIPWTPDLNPGQYQAVSTVIYDDQNVQDSKPFVLGEQKVDIESIDVRNFKLGGIAKFEILLKNNWNTPFDGIHGEITVVKDGKIYTQSKTESVSIDPREKKVINGYWDTNTVVPEKYELKIKLYYSDKTEEDSYPITVTQNEIVAEGVGRVIGTVQTAQDKVMTYVYLLTLLVILLIAINGYLYFHKPRNGTAVPGGSVPLNVMTAPMAPQPSTPQATTTTANPPPSETRPAQTTQTPTVQEPAPFDAEHHVEIEQHLNELEKIQTHIETKPSPTDNSKVH